MSYQLDDPKLIDSRGFSAAESHNLLDLGIDDGTHRLAAARGIVWGILISIPLWILLAFTVYLLI